MRTFACTLSLGTAFLLLSQPVQGKTIISNQLSGTDIAKYKSVLDDPRPFITDTQGGKRFASESHWKRISHDAEAAKAAWAEVVGFKAPDVVGKIAPEIKPGRYTLDDKEKLPFDKLMPKILYDRFNQPGGQGKNHAGNFTEFEVVEPRQMFHYMGVATATSVNDGKAQLDEKGYLRYETLKPGYPFARPSGPQKAWQIVYNGLVEAQYMYENLVTRVAVYGFDRSFDLDYRGSGVWYLVKLANRVKQEPLGEWYDEKAKKAGEKLASLWQATAPRDEYGSATLTVKYQDPSRINALFIYTPQTRRVRKMSGADTQDQVGSIDYVTDDETLFNQKLTPDLYPYEITLLDETEILAPAYSYDGAEYVDTSENALCKNVRMQRRPVYIIEMKQQDKNYIYSKRVIYIDRETFVPLLSETYDQKGRLWRSYEITWAFIPETGSYLYWQNWMQDHLDVHTSLEAGFEWPAENMDRSQFSRKKLMRLVK